MSETQVIRIDKPSFARRWLSEFLLERHSRAARLVLLAVAIGFYLYGPFWVLWLASLLPVAELGSSGASLWSHQLLQCLAGVSFAGILIASLKPSPVSIEITPEGIRMKSRVWLFAYNEGLLAWDRIGTICLERPSGKTDMRAYKICLYSCDKENQFIKIPLGNLTSEDSREHFAGALQSRAKLATIEPGALEAIKPARNLSFTDIWLDALSAAPGRERLTPLAEGTTLKERYRITKRLGGGGQATAYLASDLQETTDVVLKETILPVYADLHTRKQALEKFHEEAISLSSIKNAQIVQYLDSFVEDHRAYLVLQYIKGMTLRSLIHEKGSLSKEQALNFSLQMCDILEAMHSLNPALIHRDFTPDNLMVNQDGKLVLIDFAVAVSTQEYSAEAAGKVAYMAPEQFKGSSTVQTDIYSCGCSMHYILTGIDPVALTECHPASLNDSVDLRLDSITAKASGQLTENRYTNVQELRAALKDLTA